MSTGTCGNKELQIWDFKSFIFWSKFCFLGDFAVGQPCWQTFLLSPPHPHPPTPPYIFLGDDAFALKRFMMKLFPQQGLTGERRVYNYRHSRARRISENLFGILANRWRIFFTTTNLEPKYVKDVILAALILHNTLIKSPNSANVYRPASIADCNLTDGEVSEGEWRINAVTDSFY